MPAHLFNKFVNPSSIAVVGASRSPEKVGHQILKNLIRDGFKGRLYPVNPNASEILHLKCYKTLHDIKKPVDLAIIVTPAPLVSTGIVEACQNHIDNAIIISAGFAESGTKGKLLQQELKHTLLQYPVNVLGPNCLGCMSPTHQVNATFGPKLSSPGGMMLISQSGALVTGIIDWANKMNVGLSHAVSFGNRVGIGEIEALEFASTDKYTKSILVYLESFQNAKAFFSACSRLSPKKPIILLKGGQSVAGQTASISHTAALASNYILTKAFAQQTGVIVADTIQEWLNIGAAFAHVPPAKSMDLTILTNAGGPGVLSTDEAVGLGLELPELSLSTKHKLKTAFPKLNPHNPLDILGDATPETYHQALSILKNDPKIHNLITIITPQTTTKPVETAEMIVNSGINKKIPTYSVLIGGDNMDRARNILDKANYLNFDFPTPAVQTIAAKSKYETSRHQIFTYPSQTPSFVTNKIKDKLTQNLSTSLSLEHAFEVLLSYGFWLPKSAIVNTLEEVGPALQFVSRPAVIKTADMACAHKAQAGGVILNIMSTKDARIAYRRLSASYPKVLFQQTIKGEVEIIVGAKRDPQLGPFITIGLGGTMTNTIEDRAYAFLPASKTYMKHVFSNTKAYRIINKKNLPVDQVIDLMQRLSAVLLDLDIVDELEINPAILTDKHLYAADIKITLKQS